MASQLEDTLNNKPKEPNRPRAEKGLLAKLFDKIGLKGFRHNTETTDALNKLDQGGY